MLKRSLRSRSLNDKGVSEYEVKELIEGLLRGDKVADVPNGLCKSVISQLTQMRKDALLQRKEGLAAKMDDILGELKHGPQKFMLTTTENPNMARTRTLSTASSTVHEPLKQAGKTLVRGARMDSVDSMTRQSTTPVLKGKGKREVSRAHYTKAPSVDRTVDGVVEYELDSRRLAPRLLKVQDVQRRLDEARQNYEMYRERAKVERIKYDQLEKAAEEELEDKLTQDMLDYGSHVPLSLPLEFSKFSGKVLDMRERERKSAGIRKYDDAHALRGESVKREKEELENNSAKFARSFTLQKQQMIHSQEQKRIAFKELWVRKKEKHQRDLRTRMMELRKAVENLEKDLMVAQQGAGNEMLRIKDNERLTALPVAGRPAARQHHV